jgi:hypothetical protein
MHGEAIGRLCRHEVSGRPARPNRGSSIKQVDGVNAVGVRRPGDRGYHRRIRSADETVAVTGNEYQKVGEGVCDHSVDGGENHDSKSRAGLIEEWETVGRRIVTRVLRTGNAAQGHCPPTST